MDSQSGPLSDDPVDRAGDRHGRAAFVDRLAGLIDSRATHGSSAVFGLTGPWGSGKTSVLNMVLESLGDRQSGWSIANFTPWAASDPEALFADFFAALAEAFPGAESRRVRERLGRLLQKAAPLLAVVPSAGTAASTVASWGADRLVQERSWAQLFEAASAAVGESGQRVLIVVDDLDRLHSDELAAVLKVVRLLGRFNGVHYLLAYDEHTVFRTLEAAEARSGDSGWAQQFMEKIVQFPVVLPPLTETQIFDAIGDSIQSALHSAGFVEPQLDRVREAGRIIRQLLRTPRALVRFDAQLRFYSSMLPAEEVNAEDVVLLTVLRLVFPELHRELPYWKTPLITGQTGEDDPSAAGLVPTPADLDALYSLAPIAARGTVESLMRLLFPKLGNGTLVWQQGEHLKYRSVANGAFFDRYFNLAITPDDLSNIAVHEVLGEVFAGRKNALADFLKDLPAGRQQLVLERAAATEQSSLHNDQRLRLATAIVAADGVLPVRTRDFAAPRSVTRGWLEALLASLESGAAPSDVIELINGWRDERERLGLLQSLSRWWEGPAEPHWFRETAAHFAEKAADVFLEHLTQRDDADADSIPIRQLRFAARFAGEYLRDRVGTAVDTAVATEEDVAIRMVNTGETDSGQSMLMPGFVFPMDQVLASLSAGWFEAVLETGLPNADLGWDSRREFVRAYRAQPPSE